MGKRQYDALGAEVRITGQTSEHYPLPVHKDVLLGEQNPRGHWQWYLRDPQTDEPLLTLIDGQPYYYELDHRMMPVRLWDQNGQKVWQGNADAWGNCQPETLNNAIHQPLRLPGQFEDELTGIVQNRFRDYDPATGRYLTPDPLGLHGGLNSYRYTQNPVDYIDPLGLCDEQQAQKGLLASLWSGTIDALAWVDEKTTIPALADLQTSMLDGLDEMGARAHASGNSWAVPLLGVTYAATYTLMPTSALDVVPVGKAGKLGKLGESAADAGQTVRRTDVPKTIPLRNQVADLSASDRALVESIETFRAHGISNADALDYIQNTPEGRKLFDMTLQSAGPDADLDIVISRAVGYVETGVDMPILREINSPLVKIVPSGGELSIYSPYFTSQKQLDLARKSGRPLSDVFGLPAINDSARYGVFEIVPLNPTTVFESVIAPTSELGGKLTTKGGGVQYIVPDRSQYSLPKFVEVIDDNS
ncbi:RHS repeat-associated core domain-containing protein [Marinobacter sp. ANT_B65]|uniref:RHS repeat-associated core domain-containing protein n=1 Tax=Marinobacter sp. ANT_B65 TaxID=2039467 RepID=UPI00118089C4|nr:RHS repeat-associated core domain-containing protein [Marinobacter sp. ANT_B65]